MRILHVFRTPVGGLFRHVRDLARGQAAMGHAVGLLCDSTTGGSMAAALLDSAAPHCALGVRRIPISRLPGLGDVSGVRQTKAYAKSLMPDIIHCHGAKGGLYGRIAARLLGIPSVYTPHGGSLHYAWSQPAGMAFLSTEKALAGIGTGIHFVCDFERRTFDEKIGLGTKPHRVVANGLWPEDFETATPEADAADILFIGDMRRLKGVDVLLDALAILNRRRRTTACLVGDGPDLAAFQSQAEALGLTDVATFAGRMPARAAFSRGRLLAMPSRAESFPYIVLESCAAGVPLIASDVGGIAEILGPEGLVPSGDAEALATRLGAALVDPATAADAAAAARSRLQRSFGARAMADEIMSFYKSIM